jgi:hypothetical protein
MPCAKKSSKQAKLQHVGRTTFGSSKVQSAISDNVSEYDPSDDDKTLSEDEEGGTLDSITTMQQLYSVFLPGHLKPQVKSTEHENGVSHLTIFGIQHCCDVLYQKVKRQKSSNRSVVYRQYLTFCAQGIATHLTANLQLPKFWFHSAWTCATQQQSATSFARRGGIWMLTGNLDSSHCIFEFM